MEAIQSSKQSKSTTADTYKNFGSITSELNKLALWEGIKNV